MIKMALMASATMATLGLLASSNATVVEREVEYKTYMYSDPDPTPQPIRQIYPYVRYNGYAQTGEMKKWKVVRLENDYIYVDIFPEIGGKVWTAYDKINGKDFLYNNHVVKFRDIAMRGPWTSGGIEFNFGLTGHEPTTASPVDYKLVTVSDGSASCYISSFDWMNGTFWSVEICLPRDRAYFETRVSWYNASMVEQPEYQWMNAAYPAAGKAEYVFPGENYVGHNFERDTWPIDKDGHDLRFYDNYMAFSGDASQHVVGWLSDFFGVYYHDYGYGSAHHSDYDSKVGMKIFLWSPARDGAIWEDLLTDDDGQYVELQSGRLFNQPIMSKWNCYKTYGFSPMMTDRWTEYWFPVAPLGGFDKASKFGALRVEREGDDLVLSFSALAEDAAEVQVLDNDKEVKAFTLNPKVLVPEVKRLKGLGKIAAGALKVAINGDELVYSENKEEYRLSRPQASNYKYDKTDYGNYMIGCQGIYEKAWIWSEMNLKKALEIEPDFLAAGTKLASVYIRSGRYAKAIPHLDAALSMNAYDGEANYLRGVASRALGKIADAKDGFSLSTRDPGLRTAAFEALAELCLAEKRYAKAIEYADKALAYNVDNLYALMTKAVACRLIDKKENALIALNQALKAFPLWHLARAELQFLGEGKMNKDFDKAIFAELPNEIYREMALWYLRVNRYAEAASALAFAKADPMALYLRGYVAMKLGENDQAMALLKDAERLSPYMVFPYRPEMLPVLDWAAETLPSAKLNYYRALVLWRNCQTEEALALLDKVENFDYAPFYLARAQLRKGEGKTADLKRALELDPTYRTYIALIDDAEARGDYTAAIAWGEEAVKRYADNFIVGLKLAGSLTANGEYARALAILKNTRVMPAEGSWLGQHLYKVANLNEAVRLAQANEVEGAKRCVADAYVYHERLGSGKPQDFRIDRRLEYYVEAFIAGKAGDAQHRKVMLEKVLEKKFNGEYDPLNFVSILAMRDAGHVDWADAAIKRWDGDETIRANKRPARDCCLKLYRGEYAEALKLITPQAVEGKTGLKEVKVGDSTVQLLVRMLAK